MLFALEGKRTDASKEMDPELLEYASAIASVFASQVAGLYAVLGEKEKAVKWLDRAVRNGDERAEWFQRDPLLANLRGHPRFQQILDSIRFRRQERTQTVAQ